MRLVRCRKLRGQSPAACEFLSLVGLLACIYMLLFSAAAPLVVSVVGGAAPLAAAWRLHAYCRRLGTAAGSGPGGCKRARTTKVRAEIEQKKGTPRCISSARAAVTSLC